MLLKCLLLILVARFAVGTQISELKCWVRRNQTHFSGHGLVQSLHIDDTVECANKCRETDYCLVIDIDTKTNPSCWYQRSNNFIANVKDLRRATTVTNYLYNPTCGRITEGVNLNCWTVTPAYQIRGLTQIEKATLADCLKACITREDCWAVDWDIKTTPNCWIQTRPMKVSLERLKKKESVTNFILNRDCLKLIIGVDTEYWIISDLTCYASSGLVQVDEWDLKPCMEYCMRHDDCYMLDFDPPTRPPCWVQTTQFEIKRGNLRPSKTCYNFYFLRKKYERSHVIMSFIQESSCWLFQNDTGYSGHGIQRVASLSTLNTCLEECYKNAKCAGITWTKNQCSHIILERKIDEDDFTDEIGVVAYIANRDCTNADYKKKK